MTAREEITLDHVLNGLNALIQADPYAMHCLLSARFDCSKEMEMLPDLRSYSGTVSMLSVLNMLFGLNMDGSGQIEAVFGNDAGQCGLIDEVQRSADSELVFSVDA